MIKLTRIKIRNYRGLSTLDVDVPPQGLIAEGRCGSGKTSVLNAIGAALAGSDIGPDAIRTGADNAEILIDVDLAGQALAVRRRYSASGSTLKVENAEGDTKAKPAQVLANMLGQAPLNVIDVVLERDAKKRKAAILRALPCKVTIEQLRQWVPNLPENFDTSGHGLEVISRLREKAYERRTEANREAKDTAAEATRLEREWSQLAKDVSPDLESTIEIADRLEVAREEHASLIARAEAAEKARARTQKTRDEIAEMRTKAAGLRATEGPDDVELTEAKQGVADTRAEVERLEALLDQARDAHGRARAVLASIETKLDRAQHDHKRAAELETQADALQAGIAAAIEEIDETAIAAAKERFATAAATLKLAEIRDRSEQAKAKLDEAKARADRTKKEADRLDAIVTGLTKDAPAALLQSSPVKGLEIDGDDIRMNGVSLDKLCGAEQMRFAADIAKALNPNVGFLVVDGLERLDEELLSEFVKNVTADGHQLFGTRVCRGDLTLVHVQSEQPAIAAEE